ncbi:MAG: hypothetical protein ABW148_12735 [Sedimenticola sp.]
MNKSLSFVAFLGMITLLSGCNSEPDPAQATLIDEEAEETIATGEASHTETAPSKKRAGGPIEVAPVHHNGVRYSALHWGKVRDLGQNGGYIAASDAQTNEELWTLKVYDVHYDGDMENDKQDIFITRISLAEDGTQLIIEDEHGRNFFVDLTTREVKTR